MATATATPLRPSARSNFQSKSERKRIRKSMIRAYVSNKVADWRTASMDRADFYRRLRQMKQRRLIIARELGALAIMVGSAANKASLMPAMLDNLVTSATTAAQKKVLKDLYASIDETVSAGHTAAKSVSAVADEFGAFAKRRIYYQEGN